MSFPSGQGLALPVQKVEAGMTSNLVIFTFLASMQKPSPHFTLKSQESFNGIISYLISFFNENNSKRF